MNINIIKYNIFVEFFIVLYIVKFSDTEQYDWSENNFGGKSNVYICTENLTRGELFLF